jgi:hypothetical protein
LRRYNVRRLFDVGCGMSTWMRECVPPSVREYFGMDAATVVIDANLALPARGGWTFFTGDLSDTGVFPAPVDLILCRDVMVHLPQAKVLALLRNAKRLSGLLLATHWPDRHNTDIKAGEWRPLDLCASPYNLGQPIEVVAEADSGKFLALFDLNDWTPPQ